MRVHHPYTIKAARFLPPPVGLSAQAKGFPSVMFAKRGRHKVIVIDLS